MIVTLYRKRQKSKFLFTKNISQKKQQIKLKLVLLYKEEKNNEEMSVYVSNILNLKKIFVEKQEKYHNQIFFIF